MTSLVFGMAKSRETGGSGCQLPGRRTREGLLLDEYEISVWGDTDFLKMGSDDGSTTV